ARPRSSDRRGHRACCANRAREAGLRLRTAAAKGAGKAAPPHQTLAAAVARTEPAFRQLSTAGFARLAARRLVTGEIAEERIRRFHCPDECASPSAMGELAACRTRLVQFPPLIFCA